MAYIYNTNKLSAALLLCFLIVGCAEKSSRDVWNNYDYRHPAPNIAIPGGTSYSDYYEEYYQDNDSYYTPPTTYGCSPSDMLGMGCE